jgi:hypothetical protein
MSEEPTGVFVRLPLSDEQRMTANEAPYKKDRKGSALEASILSIGTPVTGGDIPVITTLGTLRDPIPCVRQSDAQAQMAALEAEVVRLRAEIARDSERLDWLEGIVEAGFRVSPMGRGISGASFNHGYGDISAATLRSAIDAAREVE